MRKTTVVCAVAVMAVPLLGVAAAAEAPDPLDLGAFAPFEAGAESAYESDQFVPSDDRATVMPSRLSGGMARAISADSARQFYVSSIVGGSFLVVTADNSPSSILTAGGAVGAAIDRSNGRLRVEVEGRYRDPIEQTYIGFNRQPPKDIPRPGPVPPKPDLIGTMEAKAYGGWSAMANVWRDFQFTDHLDLYGGGGIGAAGFNTSFQQIDTPEPAPIAYEYRTS